MHFPHIDYDVILHPFRVCPSKRTAYAWCHRLDRNTSVVYLPKSMIHATVAHEFVHVLQNICKDRHMNFEDEIEHMAYIMQYLMGRAFNLEWLR